MRIYIKILFLLIIFSPLSSFAKEYVFIIKKGDSLSKFFRNVGLQESLLIKLIRSGSKAKKLKNIKIGNKLVIDTKGKKFNKLYYYNKSSTLVIRLKNNYFYSSLIFKPQKKCSKFFYKKTITITKNLNFDSKRAGLNVSFINNVAKVLTQKINLKHLRKNDKITVFLQNNKIKAVFFKGRKKYYWYKWKNLFYNKSGKMIKTMFLSSPLSYKRISSGFTYKRYHPLLKTNMPHRAIDYTANKGEKVWATSDGVVDFKGFKGALGKAIMIRHSFGYKTVYAHLSAFKRGLRAGKKVKKGEVIGYVGSTGRSTGNHLHYELRGHNKKYFNPLTHKPKVTFKLKNAELTRFKKHIKQYE